MESHCTVRDILAKSSEIVDQAKCISEIVGRLIVDCLFKEGYL